MPPKVSEEYKEQRKKELLDSAMACFAEKGYQAATIDEIVTHSGMSKGAVYNYFKSKEEIYLTLIEEATERSFERLKQAFTPDMTATEKLRHFFKLHQTRNYKDEQTRKWVSVQLEFWINASRSPELKAKMLERIHVHRDFLIDIIIVGQENGEFKKDLDLHLMAEAFFSFLDGAYLHLLVEEEAYPFVEIFQFYETLLINSLKA